MSLALKRIRLAVFARCRGHCECRCGRAVTFESGRLDHFFGRAKVAESVTNCWFLHRECDELKTVNRPAAVYWLRTFREHCRKYRFQPEFELAELKIAKLKQKGLAA